MIENKIVSLIPDDLGINHKVLHKKRVAKCHLGNINLLMNILIIIPCDTNSKPSGYCRGAVEEEMLNSFFSILMTEHTTIALINMLPPP
jgi:hypothetical protein